MSRSSSASSVRRRPLSGFIKASAVCIGTGLLLSGSPAFAHHAMGGRIPATFFEGFMSGLAHPIIGLDHFAFIVAVGLLAVVKRSGILMPIAFILAAMGGTGLHLAGIALPGVEFFVAGSILMLGLLLALKNNVKTSIIVGLVAIAGLFHGYAYGESIFGAEMSPVGAYLIGFTAMQLVVILGAFMAGSVFLKSSEEPVSNALRSAGWTICGIGLSFLTSQIVGAIFPGV